MKSASDPHGHGVDPHVTGEGTEPDTVPVRLLAVLGTLLVIFMVAVGVASKQLLWTTATDLAQSIDLGVADPALVEQQAKDSARLTGYDVVDEAKGHYQIPIEQAIDIYVKQQGSAGQPSGK